MDSKLILYINTAILYDARLKEDIAYFYCFFWRQCTVKVDLHYMTSKVYLHYVTGVFVSDLLKRRRYIVFLTLTK